MRGRVWVRIFLFSWLTSMGFSDFRPLAKFPYYIVLRNILSHLYVCYIVIIQSSCLLQIGSSYLLPFQLPQLIFCFIVYFATQCNVYIFYLGFAGLETASFWQGFVGLLCERFHLLISCQLIINLFSNSLFNNKKKITCASRIRVTGRIVHKQDLIPVDRNLFYVSLVTKSRFSTLGLCLEFPKESDAFVFCDSSTNLSNLLLHLCYYVILFLADSLVTYWVMKQNNLFRMSLPSVSLSKLSSNYSNINNINSNKNGHNGTWRFTANKQLFSILLQRPCWFHCDLWHLASIQIRVSQVRQSQW